MQEAQQMFSISGFGTLGMGLVIILVLLLIGLREKENILRKVRFYRAAGILLGLLVIVTGFAWFSYLAATVTTPLTIEDVIILTSVSSGGGLISGISCFYEFGQ
jgi:hypothetical protein